MTALHLAILAHGEAGDGLLGGEVEADESYFGGKRKGKRGRGAAGKVPVFGILERDGRVSVEVVPNIRAETVLKLTVKKVRRGSLVPLWVLRDDLETLNDKLLAAENEARRNS